MGARGSWSAREDEHSRRGAAEDAGRWRARIQRDSSILFAGESASDSGTACCRWDRGGVRVSVVWRNGSDWVEMLSSLQYLVMISRI